MNCFSVNYGLSVLGLRLRLLVVNALPVFKKAFKGGGVFIMFSIFAIVKCILLMHNSGRLTLMMSS